MVGAREHGRAQGRPVVDPRELRRRVALGVVLDPIEEERERPVAVGKVAGDVPRLHEVKREPGRLLAELPCPVVERVFLPGQVESEGDPTETRVDAVQILVGVGDRDGVRLADLTNPRVVARRWSRVGGGHGDGPSKDCHEGTEQQHAQASVRM